MLRIIRKRICLFGFSLFFPFVLMGQNPINIYVDSTISYQTITGWEATTEIGQTFFPNMFHLWKDTVLSMAANDLGINRVRLSIRSGSENPIDYFALYLSGQITYNEWKAHRYEIINDNNDPSVIDTSGFQFTELDFRIDHIVNPLKALLTARGEQLYVNLNIVDFAGDQGNSNVQFQDNPAEYAEFVLATFLHIEQKYGWVPDGVEIILEPNLADWGNGTNVGNALVTTGNLLQSHGYFPDFIVPSTSHMGEAVTWFDEVIQVPGALNFITEISYHRYGGVSTNNLQQIAQRSQQYGIGASMLEHIGSGYEDLHEDLKIGLNTAWQQFTLAFPNPPDYGGDNGAQYYWIDISDTSNIQVLLGQLSKGLRQYFKFIRRGAIRIDASSDDNTFDPLAFKNSDGNFVVVVKANAGGSFSISGLAPGTYGIKYTTDNEFDIDLQDVTITSGEPIVTAIPEMGVITVYGKNAPSINHPPIISPLPDITFSEDDTLSYAIANWYPYVEDPETPDQNLMYSILPGNVVSYSRIGVYYQFYGPINWYGRDTLQLVVSDGILSDTAQLYINVNSINDPPIINLTLPDTFTVLDRTPITINLWDLVYDVETPDSLLLYAFAAYPDTLTFSYNGDNGDLTISLNDSDYIGNVVVTFSVTDDSNATTTDSVLFIFEQTNHLEANHNGEAVPNSYELFQNYPNPFNPTTWITYSIPVGGEVTIELFNLLGQKVDQIKLRHQMPGTYQLRYDATHLPSGIYFYSLKMNDFRATKKMNLIK
ncbi:MAG: T9SS C-terminal target domain-containing protein [Calditrichaeota bacterium]|nr:MAG: T9SS C-terminal target domain-containing protein [Calditrichota bacterium]